MSLMSLVLSNSSTTHQQNFGVIKLINNSSTEFLQILKIQGIETRDHYLMRESLDSYLIPHENEVILYQFFALFAKNAGFHVFQSLNKF